MTEHQRTGYRSPAIATDIIIEYFNDVKNGIVLITRKNKPLGLALPGGFVEYGFSLEQNVEKEALEETGLAIKIKSSPQNPLGIYSDPGRDPRTHVISVVYVADGKGILRAGDDAKTANLYSRNEVMGLLGKNKFAFPDHEDMILRYLQMKA